MGSTVSFDFAEKSSKGSAGVSETGIYRIPLSHWLYDECSPTSRFSPASPQAWGWPIASNSAPPKFDFLLPSRASKGGQSVAVSRQNRQTLSRRCRLAVFSGRTMLFSVSHPANSNRPPKSFCKPPQNRGEPSRRCHSEVGCRNHCSMDLGLVPQQPWGSGGKH